MCITMKQYMQTDLEADRQVAATVAELSVGGSWASTVISHAGQRGSFRPSCAT
jgi:hypothetical protein